MPIDFRPLDDSLRDCVESLLAVAHVTPNRRAGVSSGTASGLLGPEPGGDVGHRAEHDAVA